MQYIGNYLAFFNGGGFGTGNFYTTSTSTLRSTCSITGNTIDGMGDNFTCLVMRVQMNGGDDKVQNITFGQTFRYVPAVFLTETDYYNVPDNKNARDYRNNTVVVSTSTTGCSLKNGKTENPVIFMLVIGRKDN